MALWIVAVLVAIDNLSFDVTALLAGLGIGGIAVALATQRILGDLFASLQSSSTNRSWWGMPSEWVRTPVSSNGSD